ncbi:TLD-domain-containing protein [Whalleya microplaca]|nr:TLD-domain-containing protein [Whalleya microplaca]
MSQEGNLIDLSPPSSGTSTPVSKPQPQPQPHPHPYSRPTSPPLPQPRSQPSHAPGTTSPGGTSSYGLGSAVLGLWRRLSTLEPSTNTTGPSSQLYYNGHPETTSTGTDMAGDGITRAFTPPRPPPLRTASPRGLPSLEPLALRGYRADTGADERLLARGLAEEIRTFLPERLKIMEDWRLVYSLYQDGSSLATLYKLCEEYRGRRVGFVLVVRDGREGTFGAYLTEAPHPAPSYFGTGECFLWRASLHAPLPPPPSADTTNLNYRTTTIASPVTDTFPHPNTTSSSQQQNHLAPSTTDPTTNKLAPVGAGAGTAGQSIRFQNFAYTGANDYCIFCETGFLSVGGGHGGTFGLWLDDELGRGHSAPCDTFLNQPLSEEGEKFDVLGVELWVVGAG